MEDILVEFDREMRVRATLLIEEIQSLSPDYLDKVLELIEERFWMPYRAYQLGLKDQRESIGYKEWFKESIGKNYALICRLDGCIADVTGRERKMLRSGFFPYDNSVT